MSAACWIRLGAGIGWLGWLVQPQHQPANSALPNGLHLFPIKVDNEQQSPSISIHHHLHLRKGKKGFENLVARREFRSRRKSKHMTIQLARRNTDHGEEPIYRSADKQTLAAAGKAGSRQRNGSHSIPKLGGKQGRFGSTTRRAGIARRR